MSVQSTSIKTAQILGDAYMPSLQKSCQRIFNQRSFRHISYSPDLVAHTQARTYRSSSVRADIFETMPAHAFSDMLDELKSRLDRLEEAREDNRRRLGEVSGKLDESEQDLPGTIANTLSALDDKAVLSKDFRSNYGCCELCGRAASSYAMVERQRSALKAHEAREASK